MDVKKRRKFTSMYNNFANLGLHCVVGMNYCKASNSRGFRSKAKMFNQSLIKTLTELETASIHIAHVSLDDIGYSEISFTTINR